SRELFARAAETTLALLVRRDRGIERGAVEIGPEQIGEIKLGVRKLPEQKVGNSLLAAGADEQVGLRRVRHRQVRFQRFGLASRPCLGMRRDELVRGLRDVPATSVVGGDGSGGAGA